MAKSQKKSESVPAKKTADPSSSDARRKERGRKGEDAAVRFLIYQGFTILERNFRASRNEIDIIVRKDNLIVFVEVKSSSGPAFGHPAERVDMRKQQRIIAVARQYLIEKKLTDVDLRLDVVTLVGDKLEHYPDAFPANDAD